MIHFLKIMVLLIVMMAIPVLADEHESVSPPVQAPQQPANNDSKSTNGDTGQADSDSFIPSETISEDLSVPFPVDI